MKKLFLTIIIVSAAQMCANSQNNTALLNSPLVKSYSEREDGRFHGEYTSWHQNGNKKAEGAFEDNNRVGKWSVWDTAGNLVVERVYTNNYQYKQTFPVMSDGDAARLQERLNFLAACNDNDFSRLQADMLMLSALLWREILPDDNPVLFTNNLFLQTIVNAVNSGSLSAYLNEYCKEKNNAKISMNDLKLHSIKLNEQYVFDNQRNMGDFRIICFCPVMVNAVTNDTISNYWFYFPEASPVLAKADISKQKLPFNIKTLSDLFLYRYFYGVITETEHKNSFNNYGNLPAGQKSYLIESHLINLEHDLWVNSVKSEK